MDTYSLSKHWFNHGFENPEKIKPIHTAVYFFAIDHCNRMGWKEKFGFPSQMAMEAIGVKSWRTYSSALNDIVEWGFIIMIEKSKNQYSSNIIAIAKKAKAQSGAESKALAKALKTHGSKHCSSIVSINKPNNLKPNNLKQELPEYIESSLWSDFLLVRKNKGMIETDRSLFLLVDELIRIEKLKDGQANIELKRSILNGWKSIFEPDDLKKKDPKDHNLFN
tara:strand:+ start:28900 stop:29565 length:666 start_codon:yes stop_codon:yes gene_type:complete